MIFHKCGAKLDIGYYDNNDAISSWLLDWCRLTTNTVNCTWTSEMAGDTWLWSLYTNARMMNYTEVEVVLGIDQVSVTL